MTVDTNTTEYRHAQFIKKVVETGTVWGLRDNNGWATSSSSEYDEIDVLPFWADKEHAEVCKKEEWQDYEIGNIPLGEFIEDLCVGMHNENVLAGTDWDENLSGKEIEPLELVLELLTEAKKQGKPVDLKKYSAEDLESQILQVMGDEDSFSGD